MSKAILPTTFRKTVAGLFARRALANRPAVWLDMDQKALDDSYNSSVHSPNLQQVIRRYATNSAEVRARLGAPRRHAYGPTEIEALDIYPTARPDAPIHIYIHGGAWVAGAAKHSAFPTEMFVRAGAHYVVPDFVTVGETGGDLFPLAEQVCRAIAWVHKNARSFGGDPHQIYLSGHSSGAQLAGVALTTDWPEAFGLPQGFIKGALLCSGIYDLEPLRLSARSRDVAFTDAVEDALSPQRHAAHIDCPVILAHSKLDNPEFQRQSREFAAALEAAGKSVKLLIIEGYNHVELIETLSNPYSMLSHAALEQMALLPG